MKNYIRNNRGFVVFLLLFGIFRTAVADWNPILSGSMRPTLLEGDVVFVNRLAFDLKVPLTDHIIMHIAQPKRGDIVTFSSPQDGTKLIKRIAAVPGDVIEMRNKKLIIDGVPEIYSSISQVAEAVADVGTLQALRATESNGTESHTIQWLPGIAARDNFGPIQIPSDQFLMLGDNRDNSADSRYIGLVPRNLLIGRAENIIVSADIKGAWLPRIERFGGKLH
ncbi:MAG TPA: signal peptidase I [Burkholderiaceae bacterium]|jgi:signal peptidase I